jgi:anti-anti-sigma factor
VNDFHVEVVANEHHAVVVLDGELDVATSPRLRETLTQLVDRGIDRVILDCRRLSFVDSYGLGVIVAAKRRLSTIGNSLCLVVDVDQPQFHRVLEITGLSSLLPVHATIDDAVSDCLAETG